MTEQQTDAETAAAETEAAAAAERAAEAERARAAELTGLDDNTRRLVERANAEAATRRREVRTEREAREKAERELAEYRKQQESEQEKAIREAEERGFAKATPMVVEAAMAVAAAGRMRDPADAVLLIPAELRDELVKIADPGERSSRASKAVDELLEARPYLAVDTNGGGQQQQRGVVTQGARSSERARGGGTTATPDEWLRDEARRR